MRAFFCLCRLNVLWLKHRRVYPWGSAFAITLTVYPRAVKSGGSLGGLRPVPVSQRRSACSQLVSALASRPFPRALSPHECHNDLHKQKKVIYIQKSSPLAAMFIAKGVIHGTVLLCPFQDHYMA